jgi:ABC-2 type transport system permease protein
MTTRYWLRPILSVALKDIRIYLRYKTFFIASFVWPVIFPFSFIFLGKGLVGRSGEGAAHFASLSQTTDYASFLIVGNLVWMFVNINLWMGGLSLKTDRDRGTFDTHWSTPVSRISLVLGATLASIVLNFIPMVTSIVFYSAVGFLHVSGNLPMILLAVLCVMPFLLGFLFTFSALTMKVRQAGMIVQVMRTVFSILCGMQFPLAVLPGFAQSIGQYIPLTHFVDILRGMIISGDRFGEHMSSVYYLLGSGIVTMAAGFGIFQLVKRSVRSRGLVSGY